MLQAQDSETLEVPKVHILQLLQGPSTLEALESLNPTFQAQDPLAAPGHQGLRLQEPRKDHGKSITLNISLITSSGQPVSLPRPQCSRERRSETPFCLQSGISKQTILQSKSLSTALCATSKYLSRQLINI